MSADAFTEVDMDCAYNKGREAQKQETLAEVKKAIDEVFVGTGLDNLKSELKQKLGIK